MAFFLLNSHCEIQPSIMGSWLLLYNLNCIFNVDEIADISYRVAGMHLARQNLAPSGALCFKKCARDFLSAPTVKYPKVRAIYQGKIPSNYYSQGDQSPVIPVLPLILFHEPRLIMA